jgi:hypothetical protein
VAGTFSTVQFPSADWSWGIDDNVVWIRKDDGTPVEAISWSGVKGAFR